MIRQTYYNKEQSNVYSDNLHIESLGPSLLLKALRDSGKKGTIADLGCGDGKYFSEYKKIGFVQCIGIDASEEILKLAKEKNDFVEFSCESLPHITGIDNESIDVLTSCFALQNIDPSEMDAFYSECNRVLKPSGIFVFLTKSPFQQFLMKLKTNKKAADYFTTQMVSMPILDESLIVTEPSHTFTDYMKFTEHGFVLKSFSEHSEFPASLKIMGSDYPTFIIYVAQKIS